MNKLVVLALAGVVGVSGQASGTEAPPAPTDVAVPTVTPSTTPLQPTATPGTPSDFHAGIPADFGMGIVNPSTLPMKPLPIAAGTTPVLSRAGNVVSPMTTTSILPRTGAIAPLSLQAQFGLQSVAANLQAQIQAMNGNINGQLIFGTPTITTSYLPPVYNSGIKGPFSVATPVASPMVASPMVASPMAASPMMSDPSAGYNPYSAFPVQSASGPLRVSAPAYGTPTITSSNIASVNAAIAGVSGVRGVGAPVSGLPPGATNLGPSSLIPGAFISGIKYGAAY